MPQCDPSDDYQSGEDEEAGSRTGLGKNHDESSVGTIGNDAAEESQCDSWDGKGEPGQS